jgi:hypothetical protein
MDHPRVLVSNNGMVDSVKQVLTVIKEKNIFQSFPICK